MPALLAGLVHPVLSINFARKSSSDLARYRSSVHTLEQLLQFSIAAMQRIMETCLMDPPFRVSSGAPPAARPHCWWGGARACTLGPESW